MTRPEPGTPLPWNNSLTYITVYAWPEGQPVAVADCRTKFLSTTAQIKNAAYIIAACNAFPVLVEAVEQLRRVLEQWHQFHIVGPTVYADAEAALKAAKGEKS